MLHLKSQDVIHSFFVPAVPHQAGRGARAARSSQWFEVTKPGKYEIPCAELCGFGHSGMRGWIYVHTPEEYAEVGCKENVAVA